MNAVSWIQGLKASRSRGVNTGRMVALFGRGSIEQLLLMSGSRNSQAQGYTTLTVPLPTIKCCGLTEQSWIFNKRKKKFRFEEMWLADKGCGKIVEGVWQASYEGVENTRVLRKIESCRNELTRWSWNCFSNVKRELEKKRKELAWVEKLPLQEGSADRLVAIQKEINSLIDIEERMWRQWSQTLYIKDGDRSTQFFYCCDTKRK